MDHSTGSTARQVDALAAPEPTSVLESVRTDMHILVDRLIAAATCGDVRGAAEAADLLSEGAWAAQKQALGVVPREQEPGAVLVEHYTA